MLRKLAISFKKPFAAPSSWSLTKRFYNFSVASSSPISTKNTKSDSKRAKEDKIVFAPISRLQTTSKVAKEKTKQKLAEVPSEQTQEVSPWLVVNTNLSKDRKLSEIDQTMANILAACRQRLSDPQIFQNSKGIEVLLKELRNLFEKKSIRLQEMQERGEKTPSLNLSERYDVYIPNKMFGDKDLLVEFNELMIQLVETSLANESIIFSNPHKYLSLVALGSKFEKFHEYPDVWTISYRIISDLNSKEISSEDSTKIEGMESLLKGLSIHKYYLKKKKFSEDSKNELQRVSVAEGKLLEYLIKGNMTPFNNWMGIVDHLELTNDDLLEKLVEHLSSKTINISNVDYLSPYIEQIFNCTKPKPLSNLYERLKVFIIETARLNKLSSSLIRRILSTPIIVKSVVNPELSPIIKNLELNFKKEDLKTSDLFDLYDMIKGILNLNLYGTADYCLLLQDRAILALKCLEKQGENLDGITPQSVIAASVDVLTHIQTVSDFEIRSELLKILFSLLQKNTENVNNKDKTGLLSCCVKVLRSLERKNSEHPDYKELKNLIDLYLSQEDSLLSNMEQHGIEELTNIFQVFSFLRKMDSNTYQSISKLIMSKLGQADFYTCVQVLIGLADLQRNQTLVDVDIDLLQEVLYNRILTNKTRVPKNHLISIANSLRDLKNLKLFKNVAEKMEEEFLSQAKELDIETIASLMFRLEVQYKMKQDNLMKLEPFILTQLEKADLAELFKIIDTYVNNYFRPPVLFAALEKRVLMKVKTVLAKEYSGLNFRTLVVIFNDLVKSKVDDQELIENYEKFFEKYASNLNLVDSLQVVNGMGVYLSSNLKLIKTLLSHINDMLKTNPARQTYLSDTPSFEIQLFQMAMYTIWLEYKDRIDLRSYENIYYIYQYQEKNIDKVRYIAPNPTPFQQGVTQDLKTLGYSLKEEYPIGFYVVDCFIEPNIVIEIGGKYHYIRNTKEIVSKYVKRTRQLNLLGYKVITIPAYEWEQVRKTEHRLEYLKNKIEDGIMN